MEERRICKREKIANPLQYRDKSFSARMESFTRDLSLTGMCFFSEKELRPGRVIRINLYNEPRLSLRKIKAKVVWSQAFSDHLGKGYFNGAKFVG
ncbi:MAG: PilZ domain-containing protein [Candidatus Omnitrophota bacterium]